VKRALRNLALSFEKLNEAEKAMEVNKLLDAISDETAPAREAEPGDED
jgi:hypothetical protein